MTSEWSTFRRTGHAPQQTVGIGQAQAKMPRVSDVPAEVAATGFESRIVGRYQRASEQTQRLLARLYLEGAVRVHAEVTGDPSAWLRAGL